MWEYDKTDICAEFTSGNYAFLQDYAKENLDLVISKKILLQKIWL